MNALDRQNAAERREALRALLTRPLLLPEHPAFPLVRRHQEELSAWLAHHPRWALSLKPDYARLRKTPGDLRSPPRPARDPRSELPFSRRRYVLFCLLLAALERSERQTTLGRLASALAGELGAADLPPLELDNHHERRDLVHCVRLLVDLGALRRVMGDEAAFVDDSARDVLYSVRHPVLAVLLDARTPPSLVGDADHLAAITHEPAPDTEAARNLALRTALYRRLLDDPVVYYADLSEAERAYLSKQRPHIVREITEATGLVEEARQEGLALVDPEGELSDLAMPEEGTEGHLCLLLAEFLAKHTGPVGLAAVEAKVQALSEEHAGHWRKETREPGAEVGLARDAIDRLVALSLARRLDAAVQPLPAIARFRARPPRSPSLFGARG